jgi:hypothetical protein
VRTLALLLTLTVTASSVQAQTPPPAQAPMYRLTLVDGRVVDGYLTGSDAQSYFINVGGTVYSLPRSNVVSALPLGAPPPAPVYAPPTSPPPYSPAPYSPPMYSPPTPAPSEPTGRTGQNLMAGILSFGLFYGITVAVARNRSDEDPDADLGYIPIVGPILWTAADEGKWGEDGYDWLAALATLGQASAIFLMFKPDSWNNKKKKGWFSISPTGGPSYAGVFARGRF